MVGKSENIFGWRALVKSVYPIVGVRAGQF
jgi:hypothetical protein